MGLKCSWAGAKATSDSGRDAGRKTLEDPISIGPAIYGGARPDVASVYCDRFGNSGYGIIVNGLALGTYNIAVFAYSTVANTFTPAKVVRVTVRQCPRDGWRRGVGVGCAGVAAICFVMPHSATLTRKNVRKSALFRTSGASLNLRVDNGRESEIWVEVKVDPWESGDQIPVYFAVTLSVARRDRGRDHRSGARRRGGHPPW